MLLDALFLAGLAFLAGWLFGFAAGWNRAPTINVDQTRLVNSSDA